MNRLPVVRRTRGARARAAATVTICVGALLGVSLIAAGSASAHVEVSGTDAVRGGYGVITFRVPSESTTASTTGLLITFPSDAPFVSADLQPKAGWTGRVIMKKLPAPMKNDDGDEVTTYVSQVDFKAQSSESAIPPGEFDMFNISVGAFPTQASVSFDALQTYSDGSVVNWDEKSANGTEPEHPAPVLQVAAAGESQPAVATSSAPAHASPNTNGASDTNTSTSNWAGVVGMITGIAALLVSVAILVLVRARGSRTAGDA